MAQRPVFYVNTTCPYYREELVTFQFSPGFAVVQKQKNILAIHEEFSRRHRNARPLEISSKSDNVLGMQLSAFNLPVQSGKTNTTVEAAFQSSKVFRDGGPYTDLLEQPPYIAKKDQRLRESGPLVGFSYNGTVFPLEPKTFFYDWLYINAIWDNQELAEKVGMYNAFTDIEFNPEKSINCQARSAAIFVSLCATGQIKDALVIPQRFKEIVYGTINTNIMEQYSLF